MKRILFFICMLFVLKVQGQQISVMTYNVRLDVASDGENAWPNRREFLVSQIQFYEPDVLGIQEGLPHQVTYMSEQLKNYSKIGEGRDGGDNGEYSAIFYNAEKTELLAHNTFWLSKTPEKVSMGWDAACVRVCTYGLFKDRNTKKNFLVFNTHLDHMGEKARSNGIALILKKITQLNVDGYPVVLMGDFNAAPESSLIVNLKKDMQDTREASVTDAFGSYETFNAFKFQEPAKSRIDYIFVSKQPKVNVLKYAVLTDSKELKYPSDHFPVFVKLSLD